MKRFLLALIVVLAVAVPFANAGLIVGNTYDGYFVYQSDGYFHYGNALYTRQWVSSPGYYSYGYYYPGYAYWKYTQYAAPSYYPTPSYGPGWKTQVLKYAEYRDDAALFDKTMGALGFHGQSYGFQNYQAGYIYPGNVALSSAGYNGNTSFGYGAASVVAQYGALDQNRAFAQVSKGTEGIKDLLGTAINGQLQFLSEDGVNRARVAEILAKGQAGSQVLRAAEPQASSTTTTITGSVGAGSVPPNPPGATGGAALDSGDVADFQATVVTPNCVGCHGGADPKGKLDLSHWEKLSAEVHNRALERVVSTDPEKRMPRTADGKPGSLTKDQLLKMVKFQ